MGAQAQLTEHFFRRESARLVAALTRVFGVHNLALAEDVVQDAFCRALEVWKVRGVPENPAGWLMTAARNRALDIVRRDRTARTFAPDVGRHLESEWTLAPVVDEAFAGDAIRDEQLRTMFCCCHPRLTEDVQVALILNILCGFAASEVASAFLVTRAAMEKRLARGKATLAACSVGVDLAERELVPRLPGVRRALYLLFNEGYHGSAARSAVRADLCSEAIRLVRLLLEHPGAKDPETHALAALMCLHAARLPTRLTAAGEFRQPEDRDRADWDAALVAEGLAFLEHSASGTEVSPYHVEAAIAATHAAAPTVEATDWRMIVELYDRLMSIAPSPVVALSRAIAIAQRDGAERGLEALRAVSDPERLDAYPFHRAALGELELRCGHRDLARAHFHAALAVARNPAERRFLQRQLARCATS